MIKCAEETNEQVKALTLVPTTNKLYSKLIVVMSPLRTNKLYNKRASESFTKKSSSHQNVVNATVTSLFNQSLKCVGGFKFVQHCQAVCILMRVLRAVFVFMAVTVDCVEHRFANKDCACGAHHSTVQKDCC